MQSLVLFLKYYKSVLNIVGLFSFVVHNFRYIYNLYIFLSTRSKTSQIIFCNGWSSGFSVGLSRIIKVHFMLQNIKRYVNIVN
jgi:hypothetical protein